MKNSFYIHSSQGFLVKAMMPLLLLPGAFNELHAEEGHAYECPTSECIYTTLKILKPADTLLLEGGKVYEIDKTIHLNASGSENNRITFSSKDKSGQHRFAVITTIGGKKEEDLVAMRLTGSYWDISRIEISGKRVPLETDYWDTNGFRIGLYFDGPGSHNNVVEDVHIHDTHNAAVAIRNESHDNTFRRMVIHHIGEWLDKDYNAHEGEGFYIGSSKGMDKAGNKARVHDILIENNVLGPGLLGQYVDIKYGASSVTVRHNTFNSFEKAYNDEVIKISGFNNLIENNTFVGSHENMTRYIHIFAKETKNPIRVNYLGQKNIPSPTGRDNTVLNNIFHTNNPKLVAIIIEVKAADRATIVDEHNIIEPLNYLDEYTLVWKSEKKHAIWIANVDKECTDSADVDACKNAARAKLIQHRIDKRIKWAKEKVQN